GIRYFHVTGVQTCALPICEAVAYAMFNLEDRGPMIIEAGTKVYQGMIVGIHNRDNDLEVNVLKGKKLTNMRASGKDEAVKLTPRSDERRGGKERRRWRGRE